VLVGTKRPFRLLYHLHHISIILSLAVLSSRLLCSENIPSSQTSNNSRPRNGRMTNWNYILEFCFEDTVSLLNQHALCMYISHPLKRVIVHGRRRTEEHTCRNSHLRQLRPRHMNSSALRRLRLCDSLMLASINSVFHIQDLYPLSPLCRKFAQRSRGRGQRGGAKPKEHTHSNSRTVLGPP
jgi:hypothetical protein